jgi:hypothetical protein
LHCSPPLDTAAFTSTTAQCSEAFLKLLKDRGSWLPHELLRLRNGTTLPQYIHASSQVGAAAAAAAAAAMCLLIARAVAIPAV